MSKTNITIQGYSILTIIGIIFIILKLTGAIDWHWVWVLSPFIFQVFSIALYCAVAIVISIFALLFFGILFLITIFIK